MQVARLLEPRESRGLLVKLREIVRAVEIERVLSKDEILALYLSLAPYGGNLEGIRAASLAYFGKEPRRLTLGEAALLVALPQSPEVRRPDRAAEIARNARDRVLDRVALAGAVAARRDRAREGGSRAGRAQADAGARAPRGGGRDRGGARAQAPSPHHRRATCSAASKSSRATAPMRSGRRFPSPSWSVDNATGEVLARVGSADYFDDARAGQVDMTQALRSPGSALKPFIYGLAFEDGVVHPETLIDDRPVRATAPTRRRTSTSRSRAP